MKICIGTTTETLLVETNRGVLSKIPPHNKRPMAKEAAIKLFKESCNESNQSKRQKVFDMQPQSNSRELLLKDRLLRIIKKNDTEGKLLIITQGAINPAEIPVSAAEYNEMEAAYLNGVDQSKNIQ